MAKFSCVFDDTVKSNVPDVDQDRAEGKTEKHRLQLLVEEVVTAWGLVVGALEGLVVDVSDNKLDSQDHVECNSNHLEDDTAQHAAMD